jgi:broad specificity phosphatase PhoE
LKAAIPLISRRLAVLVLITAIGLASQALSEEGATMIYLVRHAEKTAGGKDPALSDIGQQRALELAHLLRDSGIETIYSTDFTRARDTAAPLAEQSGLEIRIYDWGRMEELAADMVRRGGRYLVVGHSDTTPELVGMLGGEPGAPIDEAGEYDRLYVVSVEPNGTVTTELRRYGTPYLP